MGKMASYLVTTSDTPKLHYFISVEITTQWLIAGSWRFLNFSLILNEKSKIVVILKFKLY